MLSRATRADTRADGGRPAASASAVTTTRPALRTKSLTSLRWIAALAVLFNHDSSSLGPLGVLGNRGYAGVTFFFVLSGFILTWSRRPGTTARTFWRRRFARVYPAHFALWLAMWPIVGYLGSTNVPLESISSLFLVQPWIPDEGIFFGWNSVAWSLACEAFFYALFPVAITVLTRWRLRTMWTVVALLWAVSAAVEVAAALHSPFADNYVYVNPLVRLPEFLIGITLALSIERGWWPSLRTWAVVAVVLGSACVGVWLADPYGPRGYGDAIAPWLFLAIIICSLVLEQKGGRYARWASTRVMLTLGELSFAFYLVHDKIVKAFIRVIQFPTGPLRLVLELALGLLCALVINRLVERPMEVRLSGRLPAQAAARHGTAQHATGRTAT